MKKLNQFPAIAKVFAVTFLLLTAQQSLKSQIALAPISGNIYGQPIISSCYKDGQRYVTTTSSIYACGGSVNNYYTKVYSAPAGYTIAAADVVHYYTGNYHTVLLSGGSSSNNIVIGSNYVSLNKINPSGGDSNNATLLPLPGLFIPFTKIAGNANALYALTHQVTCGIQGNLYVSYDQGQTWNQDTAGVEYNTVYDFALDYNGNLYTVTYQGVYKQLAGDTTATLLNFNTNTASVGSIFIDRLNRIIIAATTITYSPTDAAYISLDGGNTFNTNPTLSGNFSSFADDALGNLYAYGIDSIGLPTLVSINEGGTCTTVNSNISNIIPASAQISCFSGDTVLLIGTNSGLFSSTDQGSTWVPTNQGILAEDIYSVIQQPFGRMLCTSDLGVYYKDAADTVWHQTYTVSGNSSAGMQLFNDIDGNIFAQQTTYSGYNPNPLAKSTDNGFSWTMDNTGFNNILGTSFYMDETGAKHFYSYYETSSDPIRIWTQALHDTTWSVDSAGFPDQQFGGYGINTVCSDGQGFLYADLNMQSGYAIYRRPINGTQWVIDTGIISGQNVTGMASNPSFGIIAVTGGPNMNNISSLFHRTDTGWVTIPTRADSLNIITASIDANGVIFVAEAGSVNNPSTGAYYTTDMGHTWSPAFLTGTGIQGTLSNSAEISLQGGLVSIGNATYALTQGNGGYIFASQNTTTGVKVTATKLDNIVAFPNPSPTGTWTVKMDNDWIGSQVEMTDMNGKVVYHGELTSTETQISSPSLAQGLYVLSIRNAHKSSSSLLVKQ